MIYDGEVTRLYNPYNHDHLLTANDSEVTSLTKAGWLAEDSIGTAPEDMVIVYRLFNVDTQEHFYTVSYEEATDLLKQSNNTSDGKKRGWQFEGDAFIAYDGNTQGHPVYRLYNPYSTLHLFTQDEHERDELEDTGWKVEGVAFNLA